MEPGQAIRGRVLARLLGVIALGVLLAVAVFAAIVAIASAFPGRELSYVTLPVGILVFSVAMNRLLKAARPNAVPAGAAQLPRDDAALVNEALADLRRLDSPGGRSSSLVFLVSLLAFVAFGSGFGSMTSLLLVIPVLLLHELGHVLAMRAFGYQDLKVFFIPLFGAMAVGRKASAPAWQQAVVSLMGPAPGLLLAFVFAFAVHGQEPHAWLLGLADMALVVNALNLLPFEPFDGGRVASIVLFGDHPRLQVVFTGASAIALALLAAALGSWVLAFVAGLSLLTIRRRYRMAACATLLRARLAPEHAATPRVSDAPQELLRGIVADWRASSERGLELDTSSTLASAVSRIYELALVPRAAIGSKLALAVVYLALLLPSGFVVTKMLH